MATLHRTLDELVAYPPHEPRTASATYRRTHKHLIYTLDAPCWICGVRRSTGGAMETHHAHFEWASQNGLDLAKVTVDWPDITDRHKLAEWIDSEGNMLVLCLPGSAPVLRPDGSETPIAELVPGDYVLCPDGRSRPITVAARREYRGDLVRLDGRWLTPEHPVLTPRGWLPAGVISEGDQVGEYLRVLNHQVLDLRPIQPQVLDAIVRSDVIDVMHTFEAVKGPPQVLLHDPAMLENRPLLAVLPDGSPDVALGGNLGAEEHPFLGALTRHGLKCLHATVGAAETGSAVPGSKRDAAPSASSVCQPAVGFAASFSGTLARTGGVFTRERRSDPESLPADQAGSQHSAGGVTSRARWRPVRHVERNMFSGLVHDITVTGYPAFSTDGLIVHNCAVHHRSQHQGIHAISQPAWLLQRYQGDAFTFIAQPVAHTPLLAGDS